LSEQWFKEMGSEQKKEMEAEFKRTIPLGGKPGSVDDAANLNVFLASDKSIFLSGQMIGVDGGMTMPR
jgi:NAD(P)-dependent dehydrogenase (short-subunit alcohol dehydrogenase family)